MKPRVIVCTSSGVLDEQVASLKQMSGTCDIVAARDVLDEIRAALPGASAIVGCPRKFWSDELFDLGSGTLNWVHASGAGCEEFLTPRFVSSATTLTNGRIIQGPEVADHAVALVLAIARNIFVNARNPAFRPLRPIELRGKTALVFGLGGIGLLVAERLSGFGMKIFGVDPVMKPMFGFVEMQFSPGETLDLLPSVDVVVCAAPNTSLTYKQFNERAFRAMKSSAIFVNVSRGQLADCVALAGVLAEGYLRGAALDVTDPEPLPADHALRKLPNVVITEHQAGLSDFNRARSLQLIRDNIARYASGRPLLNVVDKVAGF